MFGKISAALLAFGLELLLATGADAKDINYLDWSSPHHYPGKPNGTYGTDWQDYFLVKDALPNITFPLGRSFAGSISTKTEGFTNNSAFFWGWEKTNGSLTATTNNTDEPWGLWLAGGPGYASTAAMMLENMGPFQVNETGFFENPYSWSKIADWFWVDAPVGVGYATVADGGWATDEERVAADFLGFLDNLVKVFPSLKTRPFHLSGESYAGRFIPYIMQAWFSMDEKDRPVNLVKIAVSNPGLQSANEFENIPILRVVETYPQLIGYNTTVYEYLREQNHLCGFDFNLTYPQTGGNFPTVHIDYGALGGKLPPPSRRRSLLSELHERKAGLDKRQDIPPIPWNFTLTGRPDPIFGCDMRDLMLAFAVTNTYPWSKNDGEFDYLDIPYTVNPIKAWFQPHNYMNDDVTRNAIHAPHNAAWRVTTPAAIGYPWNSVVASEDPSPPPMNFMDELAANATANGVGIMWYSGNDDALTTHFSTEIVIQNTTFGGVQGFSVKPNTSWFDDQGLYAGVVHQERGWQYVLIAGAGHQTAVINPQRTFAMVRDFFVGNDTTGSVETAPDGRVGLVQSTKKASEKAPKLLADGVLVGQKDIYHKGTTVSWPKATVSVWDEYLNSALATATAATTKASATSASTTKTKTKAASTSASATTKAASTKVASTNAVSTSASATTKAASTKVASTKAVSTSASATTKAVSTKVASTKAVSTSASATKTRRASSRSSSTAA